MARFALMGALLASSAALGIVPTAAERSRGRLMRAPDHTGDGPAYFYGPDGESAVFHPGDAIPDGWQDHPSKVITPAKTGSAPVGDKRGGAAGVSPDATAKAKEGRGPAAPGDQSNTLDRDGWPWDATLHAATQSLTKEGLWRMKVGVKRPDPKEGFPKPVLDL